MNVFRNVVEVHTYIDNCITRHKRLLGYICIAIVTLAAAAYFIAALVIHNRQETPSLRPLVTLAVAIVTCLVVWLVKSKCGRQIQRLTMRLRQIFNKKVMKVFNMVIALVAFSGILCVLVFTCVQSPGNLFSLLGFGIFVLFLWFLSEHPTKVNWRPVLAGFCLQFYLALLILRWNFGRSLFEWVGQCMQKFLNFADSGSAFVFGQNFKEHMFAFKVLPVIVFFSCTINVLYYMGAMQQLMSKIGWVLQKVLGTTAPESLCVAGNIFIGMSEAPIMIRPFLSKMTRSELNAIMTGGFATIAGGVMAAYITFGVAPEHLLCASVMNAPCALAISKLLYPETEESEMKKISDIHFGERKERNVIEAAAAGASASIKLVANIAANLIAFIAVLSFADAMLSWFGSYVGYPGLSFQLVLSYVFMPVAFLMGVPWADAGVVGKLIGIKTFLNEFLAYQELSGYLDNRRNCQGDMISERASIIATYALCGFANLGSLGVTLGALTPMAPERRGDLAGTVMKSLLGGIMAGLMTACVTGLLLVESPNDVCVHGNSTVTLMPNITIVTHNATIATGTLVSSNVTYIFNGTFV
ncbi:sodium/nucleoside cotransporter 1-like isoform X3 [Dreissena polymorpha]|nr:sodium/nucleoside cotransporter 1-like isoform X3 [Dreissena polymorpha]